MYNIDGQSHRVSPEVDGMIIKLRSDLAAAKAALRDAWEAGAAHAIGSHKDFVQTHPDFDAWLAGIQAKPAAPDGKGE